MIKNAVRIAIASCLLCWSLGASAEESEVLIKDNANVVASCHKDAEDALCPNKTPGHGLLKCLDIYRKQRRKTDPAYDLAPMCQLARNLRRIHKKGTEKTEKKESAL